jgi:hypothetical protein
LHGSCHSKLLVCNAPAAGHQKSRLAGKPTKAASKCFTISLLLLLLLLPLLLLPPLLLLLPPLLLLLPTCVSFVEGTGYISAVSIKLRP